jgi:hypothetical protein
MTAAGSESPRFTPAGFRLPSAAIAALLQRLYFAEGERRGDW